MDVTIFIDAIGVVLLGNIACLPWLAISAHLHGTAAQAVVPSACLVNRTSLISDVVLVYPFVSVVSITAVTAIILLLAADQNLWTDVDVWPCSISLDFDSIRESR